MKHLSLSIFILCFVVISGGVSYAAPVTLDYTALSQKKYDFPDVTLSQAEKTALKKMRVIKSNKRP